MACNAKCKGNCYHVIRQVDEARKLNVKEIFDPLAEWLERQNQDTLSPDLPKYKSFLNIT